MISCTPFLSFVDMGVSSFYIYRDLLLMKTTNLQGVLLIQESESLREPPSTRVFHAD